MTVEGARRTGGAPGKFLFSSSLKCGVCGANFVMTGATHYGCASQVNGRQHFCSNTLKVSPSVAESRLLEGIKRELLAPEII